MPHVHHARARLAASGRAIAAMVADVDDDEARFHPREGAWSVLEVVGHLGFEEVEDFRARLTATLGDPSAPWPAIDPEGRVRAAGLDERPLPAVLSAFELHAGTRWISSHAGRAPTSTLPTATRAAPSAPATCSPPGWPTTSSTFGSSCGSATPTRAPRRALPARVRRALVSGSVERERAGPVPDERRLAQAGTRRRPCRLGLAGRRRTAPRAAGDVPARLAHPRAASAVA
jgi:hypothetical protein